MVSAAQSAFINVLLKTLPFSAPTVDPAVLIGTGATELRTQFTPDQIPGILVAYMHGLKISFAIAVAATGLALLIGSFSKWKRLNIAAINGAGAV